MKEIDYLVWLSSIRGIGYQTYKKLLSEFGSIKNLWDVPEKKILNIDYIKKDTLMEIIEKRTTEYYYNYKKNLDNNNIHYISIQCDDYPFSLRNIHNPPFLLYFKGDLYYDYDKSLAIVGSRKASTYGKNIAYNFAKELAGYGITIISGMAYGIDSASHKGAIDGGGKTIAVLGCGIDICYPPTNNNLMKEIINNGCVISEFPIGTKPFPQNFPLRNRIISGLSKMVLVVEADLKSGSLITVEHALEQGKDILAVPGNIHSSTSRGTNKLIREGAKLVTSVEDILEEFDIDKDVNHEKSSNFDLLELSEKELKVFNIIKNKQPIYLDLLMALADIDTGELYSILTILELKGIIEELPGKIIVTKI